jgi:branched-chain amino acid transport system ATP-binding protein
MRAGTLWVDDLTVAYGSAPVLDGVSLEVRPGELLALVGGNGTGKSTLLRTIAGLLPASRGQIRLSGRDLTILRADHRAVAGVALVSGARPVFADLSVADNLRVGAYLTHRSRAAFAAATEHVLALVPALAGRLEVRAGLLSGGEQRQLALAQTLYRRPTILLADELTLGLDTSAQQATLALLRLFAEDGVGVVVVDHDLGSLLPCSDRAVVLADGHALTVTDPGLLDAERRTGALRAAFLAGAGT